MAADTAAWNCRLSHDNEKDPGAAFLRYSTELARAGRYFTSARKGFTQTLKELKALQAERKQEEAAAAKTEPKTEQYQQSATKLVSFRQTEIAQPSEPSRTVEPTEKSDQNDAAPPKAA